MKKLSLVLVFIFFSMATMFCTSTFAYTVDPTTRTHSTNADIQWNILDILDDYINFDYLNQNIDVRQQMYNELAAYINTLNEIPVDFLDPTTNASPSN